MSHTQKMDLRSLNRITRVVQKAMSDTSLISMEDESQSLQGLKEAQAALLALVTIKRAQAMAR